MDFIFKLSKQKNYNDSKSTIYRLKAGQKNLGKSIRLLKKTANILNITFYTIFLDECGVNIINTNYLYTIYKKYNISADYLLGKIDNSKYLNK